MEFHENNLLKSLPEDASTNCPLMRILVYLTLTGGVFGSSKTKVVLNLMKLIQMVRIVNQR